MQFELLTSDGGARRGRLTLAHGVVDTPVFTETYAPIEKDTFQESLFYIAQLFADTGRTGIATEAR